MENISSYYLSKFLSILLSFYDLSLWFLFFFSGTQRSKEEVQPQLNMYKHCNYISEIKIQFYGHHLINGIKIQFFLQSFDKIDCDWLIVRPNACKYIYKLLDIFLRKKCLKIWFLICLNLATFHYRHKWSKQVYQRDAKYFSFEVNRKW